MNLKKLITESVLIDNMSSLNEELSDIKKIIIEQLIVEGVDDPGILKMIFMAGGPGSGKGFTSKEIFGIDKEFQASFAQSGLKVVNSDTAYEKALKDNGINSKDLAKIEKEDPELWDTISGPGGYRSDAKKLTAKQKSFYEAGRLGMIIDGTGHNYSKIKKQKDDAERMGYDTYMVFVNTSLEVAQQRNLSRDRVLPEDLVSTSWKDVQDNLGKFHGLFGGNFSIVDNTTYEPHTHIFKDKKLNKKIKVKAAISQQVHKTLRKFIAKPIFNPIGKKWITTARALKSAKLIKK